MAQLAAEIFDAPFAAVSFVADHRQWFKASVGLGVNETPIEQSFCKYALATDQILVVNDAELDPRFRQNALVVSAPHIRFYAGMRLLANDGTAIGALCVLDNKPRPSGISQTERMTLQVLAGQVQALLELRRLLHERNREVANKVRLARKLRHVADHDTLTGLPHRGPFQTDIERTFYGPNTGEERTALLLIDVDHFKQVNDTLGHTAGDALLCSLARRLRTVIRKGDSIARLGGDEFGILLRGIKPQTCLSQIVSSLAARLQDPINFEGREVEARASIGVATYPDQAGSADELVKFADLALAAAKADRGCAVVFDPELAREFERETAMLKVARTGLAEGRIVPYYQPKVDLRTGRVVGFEALARCLGDDGVALLPEAFSHAFNDPKLARALGRQMLMSVLDDIRRWSDHGVESGPIAINTSAADFQGDNFAERLIEGLEKRGLAARQVELEVTEGVFLGRGAAYVSRALWRLHQYGVRIALDDFGTGYASLTHLKQFPVDTIKIDQTFVAGIGRSADDTSIVKALTGLGKSLGMDTIAEGLETFEQCEFVRKHGCDIGQGFLFGEAIPADQVLRKVISQFPLGFSASIRFRHERQGT